MLTGVQISEFSRRLYDANEMASRPCAGGTPLAQGVLKGMGVDEDEIQRFLAFCQDHMGTFCDHHLVLNLWPHFYGWERYQG